MKLPELKLEMLAEATQNAKKRVEQMAVATGNQIGFMRSARMRVLSKKVMVLLRADFAMAQHS